VSLEGEITTKNDIGYDKKMTNPYTCETCSDFDKFFSSCKLLFYDTYIGGRKETIHPVIGHKDEWMIQSLGCASHSDLHYDPESVTCKYCAARKQPLDILIEFDMWVSSHHVCGKYAEVSEVRQWIHNKISELRQEGNREKHSKDIGNVSKKDMIFTPVRHVDGE
jgi:hypothetical protein